MKITIRERGRVRASYGWMQSMRCAVWFSPDMETSADPSRVLLMFVCSGKSHGGFTGLRCVRECVLCIEMCACVLCNCKAVMQLT